MTAAALAILILWPCAGLVIARCCGINQLDTDPPDPTPMNQADIHDAAAGARWAMAQAELAMALILSGEITQAEGRQRLERAFADLTDYTSLVVAYAGTLTTPPPYYPGNLTTDLAAARNLPRATAPHN